MFDERYNKEYEDDSHPYSPEHMEDATQMYGQPLYENAPAPGFPPYDSDRNSTSNAYDNNEDCAESAPQPHDPPRDELSMPLGSAHLKKTFGARTVAAVLAMCLISGAAGGGATYWAMRSTSTESASASAPAEPQTPLAANANSVTADTTGITSIVRKASHSVVEITTEMQASNPFFFGQYSTEGAGSGVILSEDGYIVTNDHVVNSATKILVRTQDGSEYEGKFVGTDEKTDLAIIKIEASGLVPATFADSNSVEVGQLAVAIGNPLGTLGGTVTNGIISAKDREITIGNEAMTLLQTSAAVNPGNSGGGLFDASGNLVGIINAKSSGTNVEGLGFAIPSNVVRAVSDAIIENGYVTGRPQLGIAVVEASDPQTAMMYRLSEQGVYVATVNNPDCGLEPGDRIVSIKGAKIETRADIVNVLAEHLVGDTLTIQADRSGEEVTVSVTLTEQVPEYIQQQMHDSVKLSA